MEYEDYNAKSVELSNEDLKLETRVLVSNEFEGIHRYGGAPEEVGFLKNPHRHIFKVYTEIEVFHDDRELEFIMVKREIGRFFEQQTRPDLEEPFWNMGQMSCEQVAKLLIAFILRKYGRNRSVTVSVYEDDENGAKVSFGRCGCKK